MTFPGPRGRPGGGGENRLAGGPAAGDDPGPTGIQRPRHPPFSSAMEVLGEGLAGFQRARSEEGSGYKKRHTLCAYSAITTGFLAFGLAVTLVCFQALHTVTDESVLLLIRVLEIVLAFIALFSVVLGYYRKNQQMYLVNRFFSERARNLSFRSLTSENLWGGSSFSDWVVHTEEKIRKLTEDYARETARIQNERLITFPVHKVRVWLKQEERPETVIKQFIRDGQAHTPPRTIPCALSEEACREFVEYYMEHRLDDQIGYYADRLSDDAADRLPRLLHKIPHATFFGSIAAVAGHFILDMTGSHYHTVSTALLGVAVILPFLGVTLRGYTEVFQSVRVIPLFQAKQQALIRYRENIDQYSTDPVRNWPEILKVMRQCENFFEEELREWLVLVHEADWYI